MSLKNQSLGGGCISLLCPEGFLFTNWLEGQQFCFSWLSSVKSLPLLPTIQLQPQNNNAKEKSQHWSFKNPRRGILYVFACASLEAL